MPAYTAIKFETFQNEMGSLFNWLNIHGNGEFVDAEFRNMNDSQSSCYFKTKSFPLCEVRIWRQGDKCEVSMTLPRAKDGETYSVYVKNEKLRAPEIGFSFHTDKEKVAKSILKRFMSDYMIYAELYMERLAEVNQSEDKHGEFIKTICGIIEQKPEGGRDGQLRNTYPLFRKTKAFEVGYGDIRIEKDDVYFDRFRLSPSAAVRVLKLIIELENEKLAN